MEYFLLDYIVVNYPTLEFCNTNLRDLPDDLHTTWPSFATIYIESSQLREVPSSLVKLAPSDLSLAHNPISTIPASIIEGSTGYLHLGGTKVSELPEFVSEISPHFKIRLDNTNISFFWDWIDPIVLKADGGLADAVPTILASNSPYCSDLQNIYDDERFNFSAPMRNGQSTNASVGNWETLKKAVACDKWPVTYYPIDFEDDYSGNNQH